MKDLNFFVSILLEANDPPLVMLQKHECVSDGGVHF